MKHSFLFKFLLFVVFIDIGQSVLYLDFLPQLGYLYSITRLALFPIVMILYFKERVKWNHIYSFLLAYGFVVYLSTIINDLEIIIPLYSLSITAISLLASISISSNYGIDKSIKIIRDVFSVYIIINFLLILYKPDGLWIEVHDGFGETARYLLGGNRNQVGVSLLIALTSCLLYNKITAKGFFFSYMLMLISILTLLIVGSKTSLIGLLLLIFFNYINKRKFKLILYRYFILAYMIFQTLAVFFIYDFSSISIIRYFIEDVLKKDLTFSYRSYIWEQSSLIFMQSPFIGWGFRDVDWYYDKIDFVSTHNYVYSLLLKGGILLLIVSVFMLIYMMKLEKKYRTNASLTAIFSIWVLLFMMIMEVYNFIHIISMISLFMLSINKQLYARNNHYNSAS